MTSAVGGARTEGRTRKAANAVSRPSSLMPVTAREAQRIAQEMAAHLAQQQAQEEAGGKTSHSLWLYTRKFVRLLLTKPVRSSFRFLVVISSSSKRGRRLEAGSKG